ncbi:MAG: polysaccharide deacetylase family protein [bacterium]
MSVNDLRARVSRDLGSSHGTSREKRHPGKRRIVIPLKTAVKLATMKAFCLFGGMSRVPRYPILLYHSVEAGEDLYSTHPRLFREQMSWLRGRGYRVSSLEPLCDYLRTGVPIQPGTVFLTFDDGLRNNYEHVFPVLREHAFTATVFLTTSRVGKTADWYPPDSDGLLPAFPMLSWDQIREMAAGGIDFQPHGHTHAHLTRLGPEAAKEEIRASRQTLEERLQRAASLFAYPYGEHDLTLRSVVQESAFLGAVSTRVGRLCLGDDPFAMPRMDCDRVFLSGRPEALLLMELCMTGGLSPFVRFKACLAGAGLADRRFGTSTDRG